jgi:hypothetical protein
MTALKVLKALKGPALVRRGRRALRVPRAAVRRARKGSPAPVSRARRARSARKAAARKAALGLRGLPEVLVPRVPPEPRALPGLGLRGRQVRKGFPAPDPALTCRRLLRTARGPNLLEPSGLRFCWLGVVAVVRPGAAQPRSGPPAVAAAEVAAAGAFVSSGLQICLARWR